MVYSIGAEAKDRGNFKYKFPANLAGIQEVFLDDILNLKSTGMKEDILTGEERRLLYDLVVGEKPIAVGELVLIFRDRGRFKSPLDIFIKMCRKTPSLQGWGYKARPPNLRK